MFKDSSYHEWAKQVDIGISLKAIGGKDDEGEFIC